MLSSAGKGRRWAVVPRKRREAAVCTSEADRPTEPTPALSEPGHKRTYSKKRETEPMSVASYGRFSLVHNFTMNLGYASVLYVV